MPLPPSPTEHTLFVGWRHAIAGQAVPTRESQPACSQLALMAFRVEGSFTYVSQFRKQGEREELTNCWHSPLALRAQLCAAGRASAY